MDFTIWQKNTLKFIILGLLKHNELTGYDIKKLFNCEIGDFWQAKHSQIYPELKKLEEEKLISSHIEISGKKLEKTFYNITATGLTTLNNWLTEPQDKIPPTRDDFTLKLYFIDDKNNPRIEELFAEERLQHEEKLNYLTTRMTELFSSTEKQKAHYGHYLILKKAIIREKAQLNWLNDELNNINK
ncbi:PadR family transcriptional regulator [Pectinatus brassicae]|uniref:DNA-binding PadR family transcriptional regulator n=1 Tax=Pectinatus brassicae TaxID=862415 RepID=A0A840UGX8_9FIRM|nr:PadR family transcriptional regulator [Pectinatus brassicae]MBB5337001.1 DNA-binding PadR family transcriptional regulator [Pectinatus brassicae]